MPRYAPPFRIVRPQTLAEARDAVVGDDGAAFYAGGSELLLAMKQRALAYEVLVDLKAIDGLASIDEREGGLSIGALATHRDVARSPIVRAAFPALARLEGRIANPRVRATGTLGGNLCFAEPHSDPATLLLALDARAVTTQRELPLPDFTVGPYEAALERGEILRSIVVPRPGEHQRLAYRRVQQLEHRPMLGIAVRLDFDDQGREIVAARLAVGAASPVPTRSEAAEAILVGPTGDAAGRIAGAAAALADAADLLDDADGSADYKRHLIGVHLRRLVSGLLAGEQPAIDTARRRRPLAQVVAEWRASQAHEPDPEFSVVNRSVPRTDGRSKVTGEARFTADIALPRMAHAAVVRSPVAHARILSIDIDAARSVPGVMGVLVGQDLLPLRRHLFGHAVRDNAILAMEKVVYAGEPVVAVVAEDLPTAQHAAELVEVAYDELEPVITPEEALRPEAPLIHEEPYEEGHAPGHVNLEGRMPGTNRLTNDVVAWGDIDAAFARAATVIEGEYYYPMAFTYAMEPYVSVADVRGDEVTLWTSGQHTYTTRRDVADLFGLPLSRVRVVTPFVGGGFGSKSYSKVEPLAAVCSWRVGRPVRVELTPDETVLTTRALDARVWLRTAADADGRLVARQARVLMNSGAFAQNAMLVSAKTSTRLVGPYNWDAVDIRVRASYTNTSPASSYRGFGGAHASLPGEVQMDEMAARLGLDPVAFRERNLVERGDEFWPGKRPLHADVKGNLRLVAGGLGWGSREEREGTGKGVALIVMDSGAVPVGRSEVRVHGDGSVTVLTGSAELGQGSRTVLAMIAAEELGVPLERVRIAQSDSGLTPYARTTGADRTTIMEGTTIQLACRDAKAQLREMAAENWGIAVDEVVVERSGVRCGERRATWGEVIGRYFRAPDMEVSGRGHIRPVGEWGLIPPSWENPIVGARVEADRETGEWWATSLIDVADIGLAINPALADGMDVGSMMQSMGIAMREQLVYDGQQLANGSILAYRVPEFADLPDEVRTFVIENRDGMGPWGAKAHGDGSMAVVVPAIANALHDALGVRMHRAPFTPERVWHAVRDLEAGGTGGGATDSAGMIPDWWSATDWTDSPEQARRARPSPTRPSRG
jgi:CO/xanthine dehydrogenase Mo-binding subunit/CO/xanthine dehydrogenase FAD-binding subunit